MEDRPDRRDDRSIGVAADVADVAAVHEGDEVGKGMPVGERWHRCHLIKTPAPQPLALCT